jgi:hypothetical protein
VNWAAQRASPREIQEVLKNYFVKTGAEIIGPRHEKTPSDLIPAGL